MAERPAQAATGGGAGVRAARRRRLWWPKPIYEARPAMCLVLGGLAAFASLRGALYAHDQSLLTAGGLGLGGALALYGGITQQVRNDFRDSVRRRTAADAERRNRALPGGVGRPPGPPPAASSGARPAAVGTPAPGNALGAALAGVSARAAPVLPQEPLERRALVFVVIGSGLTAASIAGAWGHADFDAWTAGGLILGSVLALYGAMLQQMYDDERRTEAG